MHFCQDEFAMIMPAVMPVWEWFRRVLTCHNFGSRRRRLFHRVRP